MRASRTPLPRQAESVAEAAPASQLTILAVSAMSVLAALLLATSAQAAGQTTSQAAGDLKQRYQQELAACQSGPASQDLRSCQRDAAAALAAAQRGDLDDGPAAYTRNARERCMALPATTQRVHRAHARPREHRGQRQRRRHLARVGRT
ncbi:hypothetical protein ACVBEH_06200 [Roseateles sp. GG27B]